jgi:hypothetical protein
MALATTMEYRIPLSGQKSCVLSIPCQLLTNSSLMTDKDISIIKQWLDLFAPTLTEGSKAKPLKVFKEEDAQEGKTMGNQFAKVHPFGRGIVAEDCTTR